MGASAVVDVKKAHLDANLKNGETAFTGFPEGWCEPHMCGSIGGSMA